VEGGVVGGVVGGQIGGVLGGQLGGTGVRAVHWTQVKAKTRVEPIVPEAAKALGFTEEHCQLRFFINEKGVPTDIKPENCPKVFQDSALEAAWKWRFYPYKVGGQAMAAQFVLNITYKLK
jgi:protein TonB